MFNQVGQTVGSQVNIGGEFKFKMPARYAWEPSEDITTYELALCVPVLLVGWHEIEAAIQRLPDGAKRHFRPIDETRT